MKFGRTMAVKPAKSSFPPQGVGGSDCVPAVPATTPKERFRIRRITATDLPGLAAEVKTMAAQHGETATVTPDDLARGLLAPDAEAWLIALIGERACDGAAKGSAVMYRTYDLKNAEAVAFLTHLFVAPDARGYGLGSVLLRSARKQASAWGCTKLQAKVASENLNARRFYEAQGVTEGRRARLISILLRVARVLGVKRQVDVDLTVAPLPPPSRSVNGLAKNFCCKPLMDIPRNGLHARKVSKWHMAELNPTSAPAGQADLQATKP